MSKEVLVKSASLLPSPFYILLSASSNFFNDTFICSSKEEPERTVMGLAQISPAQEEWFIIQRNEISNLSMIGLHRHVLGHFHTVKVAF